MALAVLLVVELLGMVMAETHYTQQVEAQVVQAADTLVVEATPHKVILVDHTVTMVTHMQEQVEAVALVFLETEAKHLTNIMVDQVDLAVAVVVAVVNLITVEPAVALAVQALF
jgi:hypothetical protein